MRQRRVIASVLLFTVILSSSSWASTVGNRADVQGDLGFFSLSLEYDRVTDRDLEWKKGKIFGMVGGAPYKDTTLGPRDKMTGLDPESNRLFLKGTLGIHPNVDVYFKLGLADGKYQQMYKSPTWQNSKDEFNGDKDWAWGAGFKAKLYEAKCGLRIMSDVSYLTYRTDGTVKNNGQEVSTVIKWMLINNGFTGVTAGYDANNEVQEWQAALYAVKDFGCCSPYAGVKYSDVRINNDIHIYGMATGAPYWIKSKETMVADDNIGIIMGSDFDIIADTLSLCLETRLIDETAFTIGLCYKF